ncbi:unnamed protein product [Paramecium pentaurelia]|uniref:MORN repeat protein n=1 Tax=Paramecium pentaurelia TaxID=43138 RepID=A0A8S1S8K3_9CILI|nr:unnamed protein product [Paramecium pentaurelia]
MDQSIVKLNTECEDIQQSFLSSPSEYFSNQKDDLVEKCQFSYKLFCETNPRDQIAQKIVNFQQEKQQLLYLIEKLEQYFIKDITTLLEYVEQLEQSYNTLYNGGFKIINEQLLTFFDYEKVQKLNETINLLEQRWNLPQIKETGKQFEKVLGLSSLKCMLEEHVRDQTMVQFFLQNQIHKPPVEYLFLRSKEVDKLNEQDGIYFGEVLQQMKHGFGVCIRGQAIWQGFWKHNHIVWGQYTFEENGQKKIMQGCFKDDMLEGEGKCIAFNGDTVQGQFRRSRIQGRGTYRFSYGNIYEGDLKNNTIDGQGSMKFANGDQYEGDWRNHSIYGKGKYTYNNGDIYEGDFVNGDKEGKGILRYENGNLYEGEFKNNIIHGQGVFTFANGDKYKGEFKNGQRDGKGKYEQVSGEFYEGSFVNDKREGFGIQKYSNGDIYEGQFRNDKREGQGRYKFANGNVYIGDFVNDKIEGKGKKKFVNGDCYEGEWSNQLFNGKGQYKFANGNTYIGTFINNKREGHGIYKFANGNTYEGEYKNDKRDGKGIFIYADGNREIGEYIEGKPSGEHQVYKGRQSSPFKINNYNSGKLDSTFITSRF